MPAPYRDDDDALRSRLRALVEELEAGRSRARELRALGLNEAALEKEIAALRRELDRRATKRKLVAERTAASSRRPRRVAVYAVGGGILAAGATGAFLLQRSPAAAPAVELGQGTPILDDAAPDPALFRALGDRAVYHDAIARRVLYTWTTADQVAEMGRTRTLLSRTRSATRGQSFFDQRRLVNPAPMALIFSEPALAKRRFAWPSPWATARGLSAEETYGDRLVRVVLKPEAVIGYFGSSDAPWWSFVDLEGKPVSLDEVVEHPERIAAVLHVYDGEGKAAPFREYVLCNESMIEEWSVDTPEIRAEVTASIDLLRRLRSAIQKAPPDLAALEAPGRSVTREVWAHPWGAASLVSLYEASLAFANPRYRLDGEALGAIIDALASLPSGEPLRHRPSVPFPGFRNGATERHDPSGGLPSVRPGGSRGAVKCIPMGSYCKPLGQP